MITTASKLLNNSLVRSSIVVGVGEKYVCGNDVQKGKPHGLDNATKVVDGFDCSCLRRSHQVLNISVSIIYCEAIVVNRSFLLLFKVTCDAYLARLGPEFRIISDRVSPNLELTYRC